MHEFGIASEIWEAVKKAAGAHGGGRVRAITVEVGELNLIEDEQLRFWITALAERDGSPGVELRITLVRPTIKCRQCGDLRETGPGSRSGSRLFDSSTLWPEGPCPKCGAMEAEVVGGREIRVVSAEIESPPLPSGHPSTPEAGKPTSGEGNDE
ncbi:MAG: hydrogenase maturation nickel metallochaperone HypA [Armatimonadota bacterium]